jgi:hypothetical protein
MTQLAPVRDADDHVDAGAGGVADGAVEAVVDLLLEVDGIHRREGRKGRRQVDERVVHAAVVVGNAAGVTDAVHVVTDDIAIHGLFRRGDVEGVQAVEDRIARGGADAEVLRGGGRGGGRAGGGGAAVVAAAGKQGRAQGKAKS